MTLDLVQSMWLLVISVLAILILLRILMVVHRQASKFNELEMRMKAMEKLDAGDIANKEIPKEV